MEAVTLYQSFGLNPGQGPDHQKDAYLQAKSLKHIQKVAQASCVAIGYVEHARRPSNLWEEP